MNPPKANLSHKSYLILAVILAGLAILLFLVIFPLESKIKISRQNNYDQRVKLESLKQQLSQDDLFKQTQSVVENDELRIDQTLLKEENTLKFITALESVAEEQGISDQKLTLAEFKANSQGFKTLDINFDFTTDWLTFLKYLRQVESLPYYIKISSFKAAQINAKDSLNESRQNIQFHLTAITYWQ